MPIRIRRSHSPFMVWCPECERNISRWWEIDERGRRFWFCHDCAVAVYEDELHD